MKDNHMPPKRSGKHLIPVVVWSVVYIGVLAAIASLSPASAIEREVTPNLELKGTLITPPPCTLNGGNSQTVSFGDRVGISKVASGIYREPVKLDLICEPGISSWQLTLSWTGSPATFEGAEQATVVTAEQNVLGVKLFADGEPLKLDEKLKLSGQTLPKLEAVLVQAPDATLEEGAFSALGTFRAEYQ